VKKETFDKMLEILEADYQKKHQRARKSISRNYLDEMIRV